MKNFLVLLIFLIVGCSPTSTDKPSPIPEKQIGEYKAQAEEELPEGEARGLVIANCVHCHGHKLISQNRATREGWKDMIEWMQESQGLWPLGLGEEQILDYLTTHFAPENQGRRAPLTDVEWYELN